MVFILITEAIYYGGANIESEIDKTLDYETLVRSSMSNNWDVASESQRSQILSSLKSIIRTSLKKRLSKVSSKNVTWLNPESKEDNTTIVKSIVEYKKPIQEKFEIDYVVSKNKDQYKVIDVVFDGVSTVDNYRRQFHKMIKSKGIDALVDRLKERASQNLIEDNGL